jgi:ABC-type transport system substrate-binding protein
MLQMRTSNARGRGLSATVSIVVTALVLLASFAGTARSDSHASGIVRGGTLNLNIENAPLTLDPAGAIDATHGNGLPVAYAIYDSLFTLSKDGKLVPALATGVKESQGATVFTVKLRKGVQFQDGEPFNAAAVKAQFVHFGTTTCPCLTLLSALRRIEAPSRYIVQFTLRRPWASFPQVVLASPNAMIAAPNVVAAEGKNYGFPGHRAVGTGPFSLESWSSSGITLKKNPSYWQKGLPYLDGMNVTFNPSESAQLQALQAGSIDFGNFSQAPSIVTAKQNGQQGAINLGQGAIGLVLNTTVAPFNDQRVRQAAALALDRGAANRIIQNSLASASFGPLPISSVYMKGVPHLGYDPARAKSLLDAYGQPVSITILSGNGAASLANVQVEQQMLAAVGFKVTINAMKADAATAQALQGNYQIFNVSVPRVVVPDQLFEVFHTGGSSNLMKYSNGKVDAALDDARRTADDAKQLSDYQAALRQIEQDVPIDYMYRETGGFAWRSSVHNVPLWDPMGGVHAVYLTSVWIDH